MKEKTEEKQEIGYFNNTTQRVVPGFSSLLHSLSVMPSETTEGYVEHYERIGKGFRQVRMNLKGQFQLDKDRRGGKRLWERIYTKEDLEEKMRAAGINIGESTEKKNGKQKVSRRKESQEGQKNKEVSPEANGGNDKLDEALGL